MKTEHILVIRFSAMGDVAMTVPVVYALAKQYPHVRITMLSRPFAKPFFEHLAPNVGFMEADIKTEYHGIKGLNALYRRLAAKHFTAVADLHNVIRSNYLRMRFNVDQTRVAHIDKHRQQRRLLTASHDKVLEALPTAFENYAKVFEELGYPIRPEFTSMLTPEQANLRLLPEEIGDKKAFQQWIGIAPFAAHGPKTYPLPLMKQVIAQITAKHPSCRIFLFGGGDREKSVIDTIVEQNTHCTNASALLNGLNEELILMSHLDVMVSMDSANMHLASLVATPVVSIWGATHPLAGFMGWGQKPENVIQIDMECRPCSIYGKRPCQRGDNACLVNIKPETIVERVEQNLKS
ncbi:MAG: glycosyltransferase family 9 protein [Prevotella sp.]|nr:glycosyltransferase family 9 protein [Prevotella sp.]